MVLFKIVQANAAGRAAAWFLMPPLSLIVGLAFVGMTFLAHGCSTEPW